MATSCALLVTGVEYIGPLMDLLPREYRDFVRGELPPHLQDRIRAGCSVLNNGAGEPLECDIPLRGIDPSMVLRRIMSNRSLARELTLSRQQLAIGVGQLQALLERSEALQVVLRAAIQ